MYDSFKKKTPMNVGMPIEATTKQNKLLILLNHGLRGELLVGKGRGLNTYVLILKKNEILKAKFNEEFSSGEGNIVEDLETPVNGLLGL